MLNYNGQIIHKDTFQLKHTNRAFKYGDAIFETLVVKNNKVIFWEDHYFRLMASMRMLRMKIPMEFTLEFLQEELLKTVEAADKTYRIRLSVFRKDGGLYLPTTNEADYLIESEESQYQTKDNYHIDLYKDFYVYSGHLSTVKTNNTMINTLASIFADENDLDNCVLLNERKGVVEATNANIFIIKGNTIKTPALTEGCLKGVVRSKVLQILNSKEDYIVEETTITPFEIQKADEVFITNSVIGVQPVTKYKKKEFDVAISSKIAQELKILEITGK